MNVLSFPNLALQLMELIVSDLFSSMILPVLALFVIIALVGVFVYVLNN